MKIINLTPHKITIVGENKKILREIEPQKNALRLNETIKPNGEIDWISVVEIQYTVNSWLMDAYAPLEENTIYIVSIVMCLWMRHRNDFYIPSELVRDNEGHIIGCKSIQQNPYLE